MSFFLLEELNFSLGAEAPPYIVFGYATAVLAFIFQVMNWTEQRWQVPAREIPFHNSTLSNYLKRYAIIHGTLQVLVLCRIFIATSIEWRDSLDIVIKIALCSSPLLLATFAIAIRKLIREVSEVANSDED